MASDNESTPHIITGNILRVDVAVLVAVLVAVVVSLEISTGSTPAILVSVVVTDSDDDPVAEAVADSSAEAVADSSAEAVADSSAEAVADSKADAVADSKADAVADADAVTDISGISEAVLVPVNSSEFIAQLSTFTRIL